MTQNGPAAPATDPPISPTDAWLAVADDLLWAINHALSNRLAALTSITRILEHSDTGADPLLAVLSGEIEQLERTVELLRLLPRHPDEQPEPVLLAELLPNVLALHRLQGEWRDLEYEVHGADGVSPVCVEPSLLAHALLLLLSAAARIAKRAGNPRISLRCGGDEDWSVLVIESPPAPAAGGVAPATAAQGWKPIDARAVEALLRGAGGELIGNHFAGDPAGGVYFELRLPTLVAVRRAEKARGAGPGAAGSA